MLTLIFYDAEQPSAQAAEAKMCSSLAPSVSPHTVRLAQE